MKYFSEVVVVTICLTFVYVAFKIRLKLQIFRSKVLKIKCEKNGRSEIT